MHCQTVPALFKTHHHCVVCVCGVRVHVRVCVRACVGGGGVRARASLREPKDAGSLAAGAGWL